MDIIRLFVNSSGERLTPSNGQPLVRKTRFGHQEKVENTKKNKAAKMEPSRQGGGDDSAGGGRQGGCQ